MAEPEAIHFGRVLVLKEFRGKQLGKKIVSETLAEIERRYPKCPIIISAQAHLTKFYGAFGFVTISDVYLEDDIPHVDMRLQK